MNMLAIFLGGGLGSLARYGISRLSQEYLKTNFPLGTLISNILSTTLLALFVYYLIRKNPENKILTLFLATGFCGGFSTFSTFSFETFELIKSGNTGIALINIAVSIGVCLLLLYMVWNYTKTT